MINATQRPNLILPVECPWTKKTQQELTLDAEDMQVLNLLEDDDQVWFVCGWQVTLLHTGAERVRGAIQIHVCAALYKSTFTLLT